MLTREKMTKSDPVATLVALTSRNESTNMRIEATRSLATYLHDERAVQALQALTARTEQDSIRAEAIRALGKRPPEA